MVTVFTSGCWDILHAGHVQFLNMARSLGDRLVVAINTDASVRRLKGPERPWNPLAERMAVLKALRCVDCVIPFDDDTPEKLIHSILPGVVVKGRGYTVETVPEWWWIKNHARCVILDGPDLSTTKLIERIRGNACYP